MRYPVSIIDKPKPMKQIIKIYLFIFLRFAAITIIFFLALNLYRQNARGAIGIGFPLALSFLCTIIIASAHVWGVRKAAGASVSKYGKIDYSVRQTLEIDIRTTPGQLFNQLGHALRTPKWEPAGFDAQSGRMKFRTQGSFLSSGELIDISIAPLGNGFSKVKVISKPLLGFASVDFGKNKMNVNLVERILSAWKSGQQLVY